MHKLKSWLTRLLACSKSYTTFLYSFIAILNNTWLWINKTLRVLTFLGHSVDSSSGVHVSGSAVSSAVSSWAESAAKFRASSQVNDVDRRRLWWASMSVSLKHFMQSESTTVWIFLRSRDGFSAELLLLTPSTDNQQCYYSFSHATHIVVITAVVITITRMAIIVTTSFHSWRHCCTVADTNPAWALICCSFT